MLIKLGNSYYNMLNVERITPDFINNTIELRYGPSDSMIISYQKPGPMIKDVEKIDNLLEVKNNVSDIKT